MLQRLMTENIQLHIMFQHQFFPKLFNLTLMVLLRFTPVACTFYNQHRAHQGKLRHVTKLVDYLMSP